VLFCSQASVLNSWMHNRLSKHKPVHRTPIPASSQDLGFFLLLRAPNFHAWIWGKDRLHIWHSLLGPTHGTSLALKTNCPVCHAGVAGLWEHFQGITVQPTQTSFLALSHMASPFWNFLFGQVVHSRLIDRHAHLCMQSFVDVHHELMVVQPPHNRGTAVAVTGFVA